MRAPSAPDDPSPLRIVLAPSAYYPHVGGIEELTRQLALELAARGHRTSVLTNRWPDGVLPAECLDNVDVARLRFPLPSLAPRAVARFAATAGGAAAALIRTLHHVHPDVVHVIGAGPQAAYMAALRPFVRARVVFTAQGELTFDASNIFGRSASLRFGLRMMVRRADAVTACSEYVLRDLRAFADILPRAVVIPNGVDVGEFNVPRASTEPLTVLALGRLVRQKGFDVLVEAAADDRLSRVRFVVVGDGPERAALEDRARELGVADRVVFVGFLGRERVAALFGAAAAFAFPSRGEGFGIALLEAMAAGVPTVAAASGGIPEFAHHEENVLLVPRDDARALAGALVRILSDEQLAQRLVANGRITASGLSWERVAERYERLYLSALRR